MFIALLLGVLQGLAEWLPVSSEGVVTATYAFIFDRPFGDAITYALWLHLGTVVSALIVFRKEVGEIFRDFFANPRSPTPLFRYLFVATLISGAIGFPLIVMVKDLSGAASATAMALVGGMMLITGVMQLRRPEQGGRARTDISVKDAAFVGIAQGFAVLPGLSRSGLTVSALLARRVDKKEALVLSFLMSIPASLAGALYASIDSGLSTSGTAIAAAGVAAVVGLVTIRALLVMAQRINFGLFVIIVGASVLAGASFQFIA